MNRREFIETVAAAAMLPAVARQAPGNEWGSPVFDLHFHLRPQPAAQPRASRWRRHHQGESAHARRASSSR